MEKMIFGIFLLAIALGFAKSYPIIALFIGIAILILISNMAATAKKQRKAQDEILERMTSGEREIWLQKQKEQQAT